MKHQLIPNTYTVCQSTEQCKELFELDNANGRANIKSLFQLRLLGIDILDAPVGNRGTLRGMPSNQKRTGARQV